MENTLKVFNRNMFDETKHWSNPNLVTKLFAGPSYSEGHTILAQSIYLEYPYQS